jgi:hypothetical protein
MGLMIRITSRVGTMAWTLAAALVSTAHAVETLVVEAAVAGRTPVALGYNMGHFLENTNAADWFRYSGVDSARLFMSVSDLEPVDDLGPVGDGVTDQASFFTRRAVLRANAANPSAPLSGDYVNWQAFTTNLGKLSTGNNRLRYSHVLATLRDRGVSVLVNLTASPGRFPLSGPGDWVGRWELWQHYYAVSYLLARDFNVRRVSMYNEPNGSTLDEEQWHDRLRICSDAIQAAIADVNSRHGRSLVPEVFAPTTANGAEKYDTPGSDVWGSTAVRNRHLRLDGTSDPAWMNLHVYSYQKYTTRQVAENGFSGFLTDYESLRALIDADMTGEPRLPLALTEFNVRTGASYDVTELTLESPSEFTALGANLAGLSSRGMESIHVFKFAQTASDSFYGVAKNGTHYCQNGSSSLRQYGGATRGAEVYRLFVKAARGARPIHRVTASAGASPGLNSGLWNLATQDESAGMAFVFLSNRDDRPIRLNVDVSALAIPPANPFFIEQVCSTRLGGVVHTGALVAGKTGPLDMPARSVWLLSVPTANAAITTHTAGADTQLSDGAAATQPGGGLDTLEVRADGTVDGRRVALIRLPVPAGNGSPPVRVLLEMDVASGISGELAQAHVYGIGSNGWPESLNWQQAAAFLKSGVPAGNRIEHNVVTGHGAAARILGQLAADSAEMTRMAVDVTDFALSRTDGMASFLIVQEHRWDVALPSLESGDTQPAGLRIRSRETQDGTPPRLVALINGSPPGIDSHPQSRSVPEASPLVLVVEPGGSAPLELQWRRNGVPLPGETGTTFARPAAILADSGDYDVVVSNPFGSVTSDVAQVLVYVPSTAQVSNEASIRGGSFANQDVDEAGDGYMVVKHSPDLSFSRKSYFQFDLPAGIADPDAPANFTLRFQNSFSHQVRLWSLAGSAEPLDPAMTWNNAPANSVVDNEMLTTGTPSALLQVDSTRIAPGSALAPYVFSIPRLGDVLENNRVTLILSGVEDSRNNSGGLRIARGSVSLDYRLLPPPSPWRQWQLERFAENADDPLIAGFNADPDQDGWVNLLEFALGGNPASGDSNLSPRIQNTGGFIRIHFTRNPSATDIELLCQYASSPGGPWSDIALSIGGAPLGALVPDVETSEQETSGGRIEGTIEISPPYAPCGFFRFRAAPR